MSSKPFLPYISILPLFKLSEQAWYYLNGSAPEGKPQLQGENRSSLGGKPWNRNRYDCRYRSATHFHHWCSDLGGASTSSAGHHGYKHYPITLLCKDANAAWIRIPVMVYEIYSHIGYCGNNQSRNISCCNSSRSSQKH